MKKIAFFLYSLSLILFIAGCDGDAEQALNPSSNPAVEARAGVLLEALRDGDYERVNQQYDESFFTRRAPEEWSDHLKTFITERGPMTTYQLRRAQADTRFSGKFFMLEYETVHTGNKRLHHILTLILPVNGGGIQIIGHKLTPWEAKVTAVEQE
jgi:hypothetical protein